MLPVIDEMIVYGKEKGFKLEFTVSEY